MRLANFDTDHWQLRSAEAAHAANPDSFWIPDAAIRASLERGQAVKLIFDLQGLEEDGRIGVQGERMWVIVARREGDVYVGVLDNQPASFAPEDPVYLREGVEVPFRAEHVIDVAHPPPGHVAWRLAQAPARCWPPEANA